MAPQNVICERVNRASGRALSGIALTRTSRLNLIVFGVEVDDYRDLNLAVVTHGHPLLHFGQL